MILSSCVADSWETKKTQDVCVFVALLHCWYFLIIWFQNYVCLIINDYYIKLSKSINCHLICITLLFLKCEGQLKNYSSWGHWGGHLLGWALGVVWKPIWQQIIFKKKISHLGWVSQLSVQLLISAQVMISRFCEFRLCADSPEPAWISPSDLPSLMFCLSLS